MLAILIGRATQFILALALMRVATTLLSPAEMGKVSLVVTTTAFVALFLINPVGMFINRRLHAWRLSGVARYYLTQYLSYLLFVTLIASVGLLILFEIKILDFEIPLVWLLVLVCGSLIFNTINQTSIPSLNLLGYSKEFLYLTVATNMASLAFAVLMVTKLKPNAQCWLLGILVGQVFLAIVGTKFLLEKLPQNKIHISLSNINKHHLQTLINFAWPVSISAGLVWAQSQGYRYLMKDRLGFEELGLFIAGYGISAGIIAAFESILTTYFQPRLYRDINVNELSKKSDAWHAYAAAIIPALILTMGVITAISPELTRLLLGPNFQGASKFLVWGALAESVRVLVGIYSLIAHIFMKTRLLIIPSLIGSILSIALSALLMPYFGSNGVGVSLFISGFSMLAALHVMLIKYVEGSVAIRSIFLSILAASLLWWSAVFLRYLWDDTTLVKTILYIGFISIVYIALQYYFLKEHLIEVKCT